MGRIWICGNSKSKQANGGERRLLSIVVALMLIALAGCAANPRVADPAQGLKDIHDRISLISTRQGFHNGIHTQAGEDSRLDYIFIRFTLDGVKRRHDSLDELMKKIGNVCASPEFSGLSIQVEIRAAEEQDRLYLRDALSAAISHQGNIGVLLRPASYSGVIISVSRPLAPMASGAPSQAQAYSSR